jgi:hypothetical protein
LRHETFTRLENGKRGNPTANVEEKLKEAEGKEGT